MAEPGAPSGRVTIEGREFRLGATYAPAPGSRRTAPRRVDGFIPPERCRPEEAKRGGRVLTTTGPKGARKSECWFADAFAAWAGEEVGPG